MAFTSIRIQKIAVRFTVVICEIEFRSIQDTILSHVVLACDTAFDYTVADRWPLGAEILYAPLRATRQITC